MSIATYTDLKAAVGDFLNRSDLTAVIPTFISLAEAQIARDVRHWKQEKRVTTTFNEPYENLPTDWISTISLSLAAGGRIEAISAADMQARKQSSMVAGTPRYFRVSADQIELYPAPSGDFAVEMQYYARTPALSATNADNWILRDAPDVYLYGALLHAAPYLADDARVQVWGALYQSAVAALNDENMKTRVSGPLRMGMPH